MPALPFTLTKESEVAQIYIRLAHRVILMNNEPKMKSARQLLFLLFGSLGFLILFWSAADWYELWRGDRMHQSFCAINSYWNCDRSTSSPLGSIFDIPIGIFGAAWFWVILWLGLGRGKKLDLFRQAFLLFGILLSAYYSYYLVFILKTGCITCYATYVCVLGATFFGWSLPQKAFQVGTIPQASAAIAGVLLLAIFALIQGVRLNAKVPEEEFQRWYRSLEVVDVPKISNFKKGSPDAKITILEFSDFGCPICEKAATILLPYLSSQPDVQVIYYPFPLDGTCNSLLKDAMHPNACKWAKASICIADQGEDFWRAHDQIFALASQTGGRLPPVESIKVSVRDVSKFDACMADAEKDKTLFDLVEAGRVLSVRNTPTFYVNGRKVEGYVPLPRLKRLIEEIRKTP